MGTTQFGVAPRQLWQNLAEFGWKKAGKLGWNTEEEVLSFVALLDQCSDNNRRLLAELLHFQMESGIPGAAEAYNTNSLAELNIVGHNMAVDKAKGNVSVAVEFQKNYSEN